MPVTRLILPHRTRQHGILSLRTRCGNYLAAIEGERNAALYILLTQTGLRISEALGLQWDCVDLRNGFITIRRSLVDADGEYYLQDATKTKSSCRRIKLSALAENALDDHGALMQSEGHKNAPWVFCSLDAGHLVRRTVLRDHKRILKSAGLPEITLHELRHTVGTLLAEWGHHPKTIADLLGHSTTQVTNRFLHAHVGRNPRPCCGTIGGSNQQQKRILWI